MTTRARDRWNVRETGARGKGREDERERERVKGLRGGGVVAGAARDGGDGGSIGVDACHVLCERERKRAYPAFASGPGLTGSRPPCRCDYDTGWT